MKLKVLFLLVLCGSGLSAAGQTLQNICNSSAAVLPLVCEVPFAAGSSFVSGFSVGEGLDGPIGAQLSQLPLSSSASGDVLAKGSDPVQLNYYDNGPILTDRPNTIGRHRLFVGFSAQQFAFNSIDGINVHQLPFTYCPTSSTSSTCTPPTGALDFTYLNQNTNVAFKVNQFVVVATYGVTDKLDVSVIVPSSRVTIGATTTENEYDFIGPQSNSALTVTSLQPTCTPGFATSTCIFGVATGIGDVTLNGKYKIWTAADRKLSIGGGLLLRTPTGDATNYLGSGAWGFNPYLLASYSGRRLAPHVRAAYQANSTSILSPSFNYSTGVLGNGNTTLPGGFQYAVGADYGYNRNISFAADLLGSQYRNGATLSVTKYLPKYSSYVPPPIPPSPPSDSSPPANCSAGTCTIPALVLTQSSYIINNASVGAKWRPTGYLLITANVTFQINDVGLRSRPVPLLGIAYTFF